MSRKKTTIILIIVAIVLFNILGIYIFQKLPKHNREYYLTHPDYFCIAVDSYENIYIGTIGQIRVINDKGEIIRDIPINSLKGFRFNIIDDRLYLDTVPSKYVADLTGKRLNVLLTDEENRKIQSRSVSCYYTKDGTYYYIYNNHVFREKDGNNDLIY